MSYVAHRRSMRLDRGEAKRAFRVFRMKLQSHRLGFREQPCEWVGATQVIGSVSVPPTARPHCGLASRTSETFVRNARYPGQKNETARRPHTVREGRGVDVNWLHKACGTFSRIRPKLFLPPPATRPSVRPSLSPSHEQDDQDDQEDCAQPAADVRTTKVEAAAAEENDQDDQKDNQAHDVLPVSAECQA